MSSCSCNGDSYAILLFWSQKCPLQDTAEVKEAKARFGDAFADAEVDVILEHTKWSIIIDAIIGHFFPPKSIRHLNLSLVI